MAELLIPQLSSKHFLVALYIIINSNVLFLSYLMNNLRIKYVWYVKSMKKSGTNTNSSVKFENTFTLSRQKIFSSMKKRSNHFWSPTFAKTEKEEAMTMKKFKIKKVCVLWEPMTKAIQEWFVVQSRILAHSISNIGIGDRKEMKEEST